MNTPTSKSLFHRALQRIPGGVNSPVRAFKAVGGIPFFVKRADGPYLFDMDANQYIDYVCSWGPMIVGHNHPAVRSAVCAAAQHGLSYGAPCQDEVLMAELIARLIPSCEMVRMVNSGTEATLSAVRLARGVTKRPYIVKFEGGYHGHADGFLVKGGSGMLTMGVPSSPGVPPEISALTLTLPFNDTDQASRLFAQNGREIAAVIVEPVMGNANCILPQPGFLQHLRALCTEYSSVLIFDEVMTGFRVGLGGAQGVYGVRPDLTTLGKIIGGGMPVGAYGGRADLMEWVSPSGPVYQAGTLSGNPVAMAAGLAMLELIQAPEFYAQLSYTTKMLCDGLVASARQEGVALTAQHVGGMFGIFFTDQQITNYQQSTECNAKNFVLFFNAMLSRGVFFAPSQYEAGFVSSAHTKEVIGTTLEAAREAFAHIARQHAS